MDIASLGFKIDTSDVAKADSALDGLAATGAKTEAAAKGVGNAWSEAGRKTGAASSQMGSTASAIKQGNEALRAQQAELGKLLGQINPVVAALDRLDQQEAKLRQFKSIGLVDADTFREYSVAIEKARTSLSGANSAIRKTGVSSAQTANALRQLPAQFTDIFTSLAGGQNPLLVLIQQGGQIKDSFGGVGEAFRALSAQVKGLFSSVSSGADGADSIGSYADALAGVAQQQAAVAQGTEQTSEGLVDIADSANSVVDAAGNASGAIAGVGTVSLGMVAAVAAGVAAVAALAFAYKQGSDEGTAFNTALILTGNIAGTSVGQLQNAAAAMDKVTGTQRQAAQALAEVAGTGKFTTEQILSIATAAVAMEDATGKAISDTVAEFKKLADEPAAAAAKLNEQYNFLTAAVYDQITALESQGDAAGAAQLAIDSYGQSMQDRALEITNDLGYIERAWKAIKDGAAEAWDEMLGVGRTQTPEQRLDELTNRGIDAERTGTAALLYGVPGAAVSFGRQLYEQVGTTAAERNEEIGKAWQEIQDRDEKAWVEGMTAQQERDAIAAQQRIDQLSKTVQTNAEKRAKALGELHKDLAKIRAVNPGDPRLEAGNIAQLEKNIAEQYKDPKAARVAKAPAVRDDAATRLLITLREQQAVLAGQLDAETKLTAEQKKRAEFESQIADLKTKSILTADQKSLLANQDAIRAQLDKNVAIAEEVRLHNDSIKLQERSAQIQASIQSSAEGRQEQQQRNLDAFGQGKQATERAQSEGSIFREFRRYQDELDKATPKDLLGSDQYKKAVGEIQNSLQDALAANEAYYEKLDDLQGDWANGAKSAFADYVDNAKDVSGQTYDLFSNAFSGLEDVFVEFAKTGKLSFSDLVDSILADIARIGARQLTANLAEGLLGSLGSLGSGSGKSSGITSKGQNGDSTSSLLSLFSSFAGLFDAGGDIAAGQWGIVGEKGPEIVRGPVNVTGREKTARMGASNTQVFNMSFPDIRDAREARQATATAARQFGQVAAGTARYQ